MSERLRHSNPVQDNTSELAREADLNEDANKKDVVESGRW